MMNKYSVRDITLLLSLTQSKKWRGEIQHCNSFPIPFLLIALCSGAVQDSSIKEKRAELRNELLCICSCCPTVWQGKSHATALLAAQGYYRTRILRTFWVPYNIAYSVLL